MKLAGDNSIVGVKLCTNDDDILLTTKFGKCIRTPVTKLRTTKSRTSTGVRGIKLVKGDEIISISVISHTDTTSGESKAFLKMRSKEKDNDNLFSKFPNKIKSLQWHSYEVEGSRTIKM